MPTILSPVCSKRLMMFPVRLRFTPSGLMTTRLRSIMVPSLADGRTPRPARGSTDSLLLWYSLSPLSAEAALRHLARAPAFLLQLPCLELGLAEHEDVPQLHRTLDVPPEDLVLVPSIEDAAPDLDGLPPRAGSSHDFLHLGGIGRGELHRPFCVFLFLLPRRPPLGWPCLLRGSLLGLFCHVNGR